jgi:hypothetical protein
MKKYLLLALLVAIICTSSCQRDDICPETTQTTPKLVIEFYDINNPDELKSVSLLNVIAEGENDFYFETSENVNTITIPLRTVENFTNYTFIRNNDIPEDSELVSNEDQVRFNYAVNLEYVSRSCSYKAEFLDFNANLVDEEETVNWIKGIEVQQPNEILNEQNTHLYIYH